MNRLITSTTILASFALFSGFKCDQPLNQDPGFDLWCGDRLCAWTTDEGEIRRVPTWHRSDWGVEMVGPRVRISQLSPATSADADCFFFEMLVDRDDSVEVFVEMDFLDDGVHEYSHPVTSDDWQPARYRIRPPRWYETVRFILRKEGEGRAVLAQIRITPDSECTGDPLELTNRPDGAECLQDGECMNGACASVLIWDLGGTEPDHVWELRTCGSCQGGSDCPAGEACGLEAVDGRWMIQDCGPAGRHVLGERCAFDEECATGICCEHVCSQCCRDEDCADLLACEELAWQPFGEAYEGQLMPWQCAPGQGLGAEGDPCLQNADCAGGSCLGTGDLRRCNLDGRRCQDNTGCPSVFDDGICLPYGVAGGACQ